MFLSSKYKTAKYILEWFSWTFPACIFLIPIHSLQAIVAGYKAEHHFDVSLTVMNSFYDILGIILTL